MKLSIIIVNYNGAKFLEKCLASVLAAAEDCSGGVEVAVIDNASKDNSAEVLELFRNRVQVLLNPKNLGFSAGNNKLATLSKSEYLFFLNNDTETQKNALSVLLRYLDQNPAVAAVAPQLLNPDGSIQIPGNPLFKWVYRAKKPVSLSFLSGAAFMVRRSVFEAVGRFDENYFFYNEDLDLCREIKKRGFRLMMVPEAKVLHYGGQASQTNKLQVSLEGIRGGLYYVKKQYPGWVYPIYRAGIGLGAGLALFGLLPFAISDRYRVHIKMAFAVCRITLKNDILLKRDH